MKYYLIRGKNFLLIPLPLIDKAFSGMTIGLSKEKLSKYKRIAYQWILRSDWEEIKIRNSGEYEDRVIPLLGKEFNWLKGQYNQVI